MEADPQMGSLPQALLHPERGGALRRRTRTVCHGACEQKEPAPIYNRRVEEAVNSLKKSLPSFTLLDEGRNPQERSCILIEQGNFTGWATCR